MHGCSRVDVIWGPSYHNKAYVSGVSYCHYMALSLMTVSISRPGIRAGVIHAKCNAR